VNEKNKYNQESINQFINICRKHFFKENIKEYKDLITDLVEWLYNRDHINVKLLPIYYKKDKKLRLRKNPTYLTDGRMSIQGKELCLVFNDDLMKKYYKENKYIGFIELIFHEWGHFLQLLFLNNIQTSQYMPSYLLENGKQELESIKNMQIYDASQTQENLEKAKNFAKWLELSNKKNVMDELESLVEMVENTINISENKNEKDLSILNILKLNLEVERKIYAYLCKTIEGEHVIENVSNPKQLIKEIVKFRKWYGGRFVVLEACVLGIKFSSIKNETKMLGGKI